MSDSIKKYHELLEEGRIETIEKYSNGYYITAEQKQQAYRLLTEYDEEVIKFAFNRIMFG
tara:strand:+ start:37 stop:216 length:180 start_codon:yes stop_codon:yes gene_type:complete